MTDQVIDEPTWPTHCETCGTELAHGTIDFDEDNEKRAELNPGEMVAVDYCPNPACPGKEAAPAG
jgi:hypothetical protein